MSKTYRTRRGSWEPLVARAAQLARAFEERFGRPPTLRRLHYELISDREALAWGGRGYQNERADYSELSKRTAEGRRNGSFPDLSEDGREIYQVGWFHDADDLREHVRNIARLDRTEGQDVTIVAAVEKHGSRGFLHDWFNGYGLPVVSLGGYASQTLVDKISRYGADQERPMIILYAGDYDPTGWDIDRDFRKRLNGNVEVRRLALTTEQLERYNLPRDMEAKPGDPRAERFRAEHGGLWQTEMDALDPDVLREVFMSAFRELWDEDAYKDVLEEEESLLSDVLGEAA